jgi:transposase
MSGDSFTRSYSVVADTRRRWSDEEKEAIVAEAAFPGANVSAVARRHGIKPSLLFRWRRKAREAGRTRRGEPTFLSVALAPRTEATEAPVEEPATNEPPQPGPPANRAPDRRIEIELTNGRRIKVGADFEVGALKRILDLLEKQ